MKRIVILTIALLAGFTCMAQTPKGSARPVENEIFTVVEQDPEFPGGMDKMVQWLGSNVTYPATARANGVEGTVFVTFVVETDGSISGAKVVNAKPEHADLEAEALRAVRAMPKWKPGKQRGKKVRVQFTLPIQFKL